MRPLLWSETPADESDTDWARRDHLPIVVVLIWIGALVATACGLYAAGLIGR